MPSVSDHNKNFIFSVIMAIHNTGRYLDQSISSLLNQTIDYAVIQIILINDGSIDNSEEICLKYKKLYLNNIIYIKTKNEGVSKARNLGMRYAKGEFINFLDPDDYWDYKAFEYVLKFFKNESSINFVSGRLKFFEGRNDYHPLDYKFYKTRIVNLNKEYNCIQSSSSTSFFRKSYIFGKKFEEGLLSGEDTRFVNEILLINPKMGLIKEAVYFCRRREDSSSRTQTQKTDIKFYFNTINDVSLYLIERSKFLYNKILPFIQFYVAYDLLYRIESPSYKYLNLSNYIKYYHLIDKILLKIEDKYIMEQKNGDKKLKIAALSKKYNRDLRYDIIYENGTLKYKEYNLINLRTARNLIIWKKITIEKNILYLEGVDNLWIPKDNYFYFCKLGNKTFYPKIEPYSNNDFITMFGVIEKGKIISFNIPIENKDIQILYTFFSYMNNTLEILTTPGYFSGIPSLSEGYFISENYILKRSNNRLTLYKYNEYLEKYFEYQYCNQLKILDKSYILNLRKSLKAYRRRIKRRKFKKEIWIINDKKDKAGDNGEYFFRYLNNKKLLEVNIYFVILKNSSDYQRLKKIGNILDLNSYEYKNMFLKSDKLISSVSEFWVDNPFGDDKKYIRDLYNFKFIYIQNGIIKDDLSNYLHRIKRNIDLFITSTKKEYNSILSFEYGYNKNNILLTGLPRFDELENYNKYSNNKKIDDKIILIMPTWRKYIKAKRESPLYKNIYSDTFKYTKFYNFYNDLINDFRLMKMMQLYNYTGIFCLHEYFGAQWIDFKENKLFKIKNECNYKELLIKGSLLVTDYSSIFFDFAYLKKPVIYTHFDYKEYRLNQYIEGYFNYRRDGFGNVYNNLNKTIDAIIKEMKNGCKLNKKYLRRINEFFTFFDEHNNDRLFGNINKITNINIKINIMNKIYMSEFCSFLILLKIIKIINRLSNIFILK